jgi:thiosulfate/3-mercaptopyruvate sulfurtransferase
MTVPLLVSTDWLAEHLADPAVRVVDVRWSLLDRDKGRNAWLDAHVPGAVFLDLDRDLASPRGQGPGRHPLPRPEAFADTMSRAGIGAGTHVIACDFGDASTAARVWWLLRYFGHDRVSVLDGGMARWTAEGRPTESASPSFAPQPFVARPRPGMRVDADELERLRSQAGTLVIDSRAPERYEGRTEPIDPVAGHVPGARNHPYPANVRAPDDPRFKDPALLRERFAQLGADRADTVVCYCGSGVNACQNLLALQLAGFTGGLLYEGSWSDWCSVPTRPMKTGPEP